MAVPPVSTTISHSPRSLRDRTRREDRHLKFYELRDNLKCREEPPIKIRKLVARFLGAGHDARPELSLRLLGRRKGRRCLNPAATLTPLLLTRTGPKTKRPPGGGLVVLIPGAILASAYTSSSGHRLATYSALRVQSEPTLRSAG